MSPRQPVSGAATVEIPWRDWLHRWDVQQSVYIEGREEVFAAVFAAVDVLAPGPITMLDLASGPGCISERFLRRRPEASAVAVDVDPVLLAVGQGALDDLGGRLRWVHADLRNPHWTADLEPGGFDAVLSSTALHWLEAPTLARVYHDLAELLRQRGVVVNCDGFGHPDSAPGIGAAMDRIDHTRQERAVRAGAEGWGDWWDALRAEPALTQAFADRDRVLTPATGRIFPEPGRPRHKPSLAFHEAALREAGFTEVASVWQDLHRRILVALR